MQDTDRVIRGGVPVYGSDTEYRVIATVADGVARGASEAPERSAIVSPSGDRTFRELDDRANQLIAALRRRGLHQGDAIVLVCSNRPEFAEVFVAAIRYGLRLTPINWHLGPQEIGYIADDSEAKAFVADARFAEACAAAARLAPRATARLSLAGPIDGFEDYEAALGAEPADPVTADQPGSTMLYTSGTTGRPKGVHRRVQPKRLVAGREPPDPDASRNLCTGPLYHAAPLLANLNVPLAEGVGVVLMDGWDPEECLRLIERYRITHTHMVATMFHRLLALPDEVKAKYDLSSLAYVVHGAAPTPVHVKQALMDWFGPIVHEYYAATEGAGTTISAEEWLSKPGSVGKAVLGIEVRDDDGRPVAAGVVGTVYARSPEDAGTRFEYFKDPDKTARAYSHKGAWFTLGDMGYLDSDGYLFLTDRSADLIISGGVNIYPAEIDGILLEHPAVADACTIGVPNAEWGEEVKSVVVLKTDADTSEAELIGWCRERLAGFKCPRSIDFADSLPRHDTGKLYRRLVRETYREGKRWGSAKDA
jgi:long-chain acyl-CoA synthetase